MASMRLIMLLILYHTITNDITAVPLGKIKQDYEVSGFTAERNIEDNLQETKRIKRADPVTNGSEPTCETGAKYVYVMEPICLVKKSTYFPELDLCLRYVFYVPRMPDGKKGGQYIAYKHNLYKYFKALVIRRRKMCPKTPTTIKPSFSTGASISKNPPLLKKSSFFPQSKLPSNTTTFIHSNPVIENSTSSTDRHLSTELKLTTVRASLLTKLTLSTRGSPSSPPLELSTSATISTNRISPTRAPALSNQSKSTTEPTRATALSNQSKSTTERTLSTKTSTNRIPLTKTPALSNESKSTTKPTLSTKTSLLSSTTLSSIPNSPTKNSSFSSNFPTKPTPATKSLSPSTITIVKSSP